MSGENILTSREKKYLQMEKKYCFQRKNDKLGEILIEFKKIYLILC